MIRIFRKTTRWESRSVILRSAGNGIESGKGSLRSSPPGQTGETCELDPSTLRGVAPGIADLSPLSQSSFSRTMRRDRQDTKGRRAQEQRRDAGLLFQDLRQTRLVESAVGTVHPAGGAESTLLFSGGGEGGAILLLTSCSVVRTITSLIGYLWRTVEITIRPLRLQCRR